MSSIPEIVIAPPLSVPLRAGPLRLVFDCGALRWVRLGEREVLRGIYLGVREVGWTTVPGVLSDLSIEADPESFRIRFLSSHRRGSVAFEWHGAIDGEQDGRILFSMDGTAEATFLCNRIGFCVLHPAECSGRPCTVETTAGERHRRSFPSLVSPHQPFLDVRALAQQVVPGVEVEVRMEGDSFETEDQRNWSDASFKTYCPPLRLPIPMEIQKGTRLKQTVSLCLFGDASEPVREAAASVPGALPKRRDGTEPVVVTVEPSRACPRPALGLAGAGAVALDAARATRIRSLALDHLRADLPLESAGWEACLERAVANAELVQLPLELALFLPDDATSCLRALARQAAALRPRVASWLLFGSSSATPSDRFTAAARDALSAVDPAALFSGGTDGHFADLNRSRPSTQGLDRVSFALTPQVHAFDDATLVECFASLRDLADTARSFAAPASLGISPISLRPRVDKRPLASRDPQEPPFTDDPRQRSAFAAAWLLGFVTHAAAAGFASLTFFELAGPRGIMDERGVFPLFDAFAELGAVRSALWSIPRSRRPERVQALALRDGERTRVLACNMTDTSHSVRVEGLAGSARVRPLGASDAVSGGFELALGPHAILVMDVVREVSAPAL